MTNVALPVSLDVPRRELKHAIEQRGVSLRMLSHLIGHNAAFLEEYLERGTPRRLGDLDRRHLAMYLDIDERRLGARDPWAPTHGIV